MRSILSFSLIALVGWGMVLEVGRAQEAQEAVHEELRSLRTNIIAAISRGDIPELLGHCHSNLVVTWQNGEVCRGHEGLRAFYERMGKESWKGYLVPPTPDELTLLYGEDTGLSFGETVSQYELLGQQLVFTNRWTATLVREDGRWLLAAYHISVNALDNPIINAAKRGVVWVGGGGLFVGMAMGILLFRRRRKR